MSRPFEFTRAVSNSAWLRQKGKCAVCGLDCTDLNDNAHHVVPNQSMSGLHQRQLDLLNNSFFGFWVNRLWNAPHHK